MRDAPRRRLDSLIALICDFDREIDQTTTEIEQRAKADDRVDVLTQIRGVGRYTAMLIIAEIRDIHRFATASVLLARPDPERAQLRRQRPARTHHPPGLTGVALGAN